MNIAIFASGSGSNFQALVDDEFIKPYVKLLVCDKPNAYVLERANKHDIPVFLFEAKNYPDKEAFETEILLELRRLEIDLLVLAGYMRLIGPTLLAEFPEQIVNLHPSLLPEFKRKRCDWSSDSSECFRNWGHRAFCRCRNGYRANH